MRKVGFAEVVGEGQGASQDESSPSGDAEEPQEPANAEEPQAEDTEDFGEEDK